MNFIFDSYTHHIKYSVGFFIPLWCVWDFQVNVDALRAVELLAFSQSVVSRVREVEFNGNVSYEP